jgi:hypothetical protein
MEPRPHRLRGTHRSAERVWFDKLTGRNLGSTPKSFAPRYQLQAFRAGRLGAIPIGPGLRVKCNLRAVRSAMPCWSRSKNCRASRNALFHDIEAATMTMGSDCRVDQRVVLPRLRADEIRARLATDDRQCGEGAAVEVLELRATSSRTSPSLRSSMAPMPDLSIGAPAGVCCDIARWHRSRANRARLADRQRFTGRRRKRAGAVPRSSGGPRAPGDAAR